MTVSSSVLDFLNTWVIVQAMGDMAPAAVLICLGLSLALAVLCYALLAPRKPKVARGTRRSFMLAPRLLAGATRLVYLWVSFCLVIFSILLLGCYISVCLEFDAPINFIQILVIVVTLVVLELLARLTAEAMMLPIFAVEELTRIRRAVELGQGDFPGAPAAVGPDPEALAVPVAGGRTTPIAPVVGGPAPVVQGAPVPPQAGYGGDVAVPQDPFVPADQRATSMADMWGEGAGGTVQTAAWRAPGDYPENGGAPDAYPGEGRIPDGGGEDADATTRL